MQHTSQGSWSEEIKKVKIFMTKTTLNFLIKDSQILLAMKKRSFGKDKWNGVGGKLQEGETLEDAIVRETEEEIGVRVEKENLESVGIIDFIFTHNPDWDQECHVFITKKWQGEPGETEEMRPEWYSFDKIPYDSMWVDDRYWLPLVLEGKKIKAKFVFGDSGKTLEKWEVGEGL